MIDDNSFRNIYISNYLFNRKSDYFTIDEIYGELRNKNIKIERHELKKLIKSLVSTGNVSNNIWNYSVVRE